MQKKKEKLFYILSKLAYDQNQVRSFVGHLCKIKLICNVLAKMCKTGIFL